MGPIGLCVEPNSSLKRDRLGPVRHTVSIWEGDLIAGSRNSFFATLVERCTRYVIFHKVGGKEPKTVAAALDAGSSICRENCGSIWRRIAKRNWLTMRACRRIPRSLSNSTNRTARCNAAPTRKATASYASTPRKVSIFQLIAKTISNPSPENDLE